MSLKIMSIEEEWENYLNIVGESFNSQDDVDRHKAGFYAGASIMFLNLQRFRLTDDVTGIENLRNELQKFFEVVRSRVQ